MKIRQLCIEDVCDFVGGSQPPKSTFINKPAEGYVRLIQTRDYKTDSYPTYIPIGSTKKFCDDKDIMIGRYGPPIFQICRGLSGAYNVALLKAEPKGNIDREYLYYFLKQESVFKYVDKLSARTGGQTGVDLVSLNKYPISLPESIDDQRRIVTVLSTIDAKINCNNRIIAELESAIRALYDYWFVQFDFPDSDGNPYKSSGGKMTYNAVFCREIPEGWETGSLNEFIKLERGVTYAKEDICTSSDATSIGVLRATNVTKNVIDLDDLVYIPNAKVGSAQLLTKFSALIVMSSGSKEHVGKNAVYYFNEPLSFGAFCSKIESDKDCQHFINTFLQSSWFKTYITNQCLGTNINNLTNDHIRNCPIIRPNENTLELFNESIATSYQELAVNAVENQQLAKLRDYLLPMLMNGQITVA